MCVFLYVEFPTSWTNFLVDTYRGWIEKVLLSDSKRLSEELAAAGESSRESVLEKWESLVRKRDQVCDNSVTAISSTQLFCSFRML